MGTVWAIVVAAGAGSRFGGAKQYERARRPPGARLVARPRPGRRRRRGRWWSRPTRRPTPEPAADVGRGRRATPARRRCGPGWPRCRTTPRSCVVHDAARPLAAPTCSPRWSTRCGPGPTPPCPASPVVDTHPPRERAASVDRDELVAVQTPQALPRRRAAGRPRGRRRGHRRRHPGRGGRRHGGGRRRATRATARSPTRPTSRRRPSRHGAADAAVRVGLGLRRPPLRATTPTGRSCSAGSVFDGAPGLVGHSDADVVAHACADALLGAAGLGDIGEHFPDTDPAWAGADSIGLLAEAHPHGAGRGLGAGQRRLLGGRRRAEAGAPARPRCSAGSSDGGRRAGHGEGPPGRGPRRPRPGRGRRLLGGRPGDPTVSPPSGRPGRSAPGPQAAGGPKPPAGAGRRPAVRARPQPGEPRPRPTGCGRGAPPRAPAPRAASAATRSRAARRCASCCWPGGAGCARSCSPPTSTPRRSSTTSASWPPSAGCRCARSAASRLEAQARTDAPQGVVAQAADAARGRPRRPGAGRPGGSRPPFLARPRRRHRSRATSARCCASAEAAGVTGVVLPRHRAVHVTPTVDQGRRRRDRAPADGAGRRPAGRAGPAAGPGRVDRRPRRPTPTATLWDVDLGGEPVALVLGAEGSGLGRLARQRCDEVARHPARAAGSARSTWPPPAPSPASRSPAAAPGVPADGPRPHPPPAGHQADRRPRCAGRPTT